LNNHALQPTLTNRSRVRRPKAEVGSAGLFILILLGHQNAK
jgi:hypothetical protein